MDASARSSKLIRGATGDWEVVIGLEVHAQVTSHAKLFSGASTEFGAEPNSQVALIDAAFPGMLPTPNIECIRQAVRTGMALEAQINKWSRFDRKNYFYADLPQGYQISQLYHPLVGEGAIEKPLLAVMAMSWTCVPDSLNDVWDGADTYPPLPAGCGHIRPALLVGVYRFF